MSRMSKVSRAIVVDTSIARAAGSSEDEVSISCRSFLDSMLKLHHEVVMSAEIEAEWKKHRSRYTSRWLITMHQKRKVCRVDDNHQFKEILADIVEELFDEEKIDSFQRIAIHKDLLLITAADRTDGLIASKDDRMRKLLRFVAVKNAKTASIVWVDPTNEVENCIQWLENGASPSARPNLGDLAEKDGVF
jgi:hypothetical protein